MTKNKLVLIVVVLAVALVWRGSSGGAPLADGAYLIYQQGESQVRLTFQADGGSFRTHVEVTDSDGETEVAEYMDGHDEVVNGRMRSASGAIFELGLFGPLWVSPGQLKEGGSAYGQRINEVRSFNGRDVAVVAASMGMGAALRGEWYYDVVTGFLVGGLKATALSSEGARFELVGSNVEGLEIP